MTVFVSIGNSDDRLTQREWSAFRSAVHKAIKKAARMVHGAWVSPSAAPWQNACWAFEPIDGIRPELRDELRHIAEEFRQDSVAWAEADTEFLTL